MLLFFAFIFQVLNIEETVRAEIARIVAQYYTGEKFQTEVSIKWLPQVLLRVQPETVTGVTFLGNGAPLGTSVFNVRFQSGGRSMSQTVQANVSVKQLLPVYSRRVMPGERLNATEIRYVWVERSSTMGEVISEAAQLDSMVVVGIIQPGEPIKKAEVKLIPTILPGQTVEMTMNAGGLAVVLICKAREPAAIGDRIKVWSESTRKHYLATITSRNTALWISTL
jgi:flagella basal body P-ring formation protein FlgA